MFKCILFLSFWLLFSTTYWDKGLPWWLRGKNHPAKAGDVGLVSGSGRSPGEGNGNPLQNSCLGNLMDRGSWQAIVYGVAKGQTRLSEWIITTETNVCDFSLWLWICFSFAYCSVQLLSHVQLFVAPWTAAYQVSLSITNSWSLLKLLHWVSDAIQPSHPLLYCTFFEYYSFWFKYFLLVI